MGSASLKQAHNEPQYLEGGKKMGKDINTMTAKELKIALTKAKVAFKSKATPEELREILTQALDRAGLGVNPANDPVCDSFGSPKAKNDLCAACPTDHGKRNEACLEIAEAAKARATKKVTPEKRQTVKAKYANFAELKESVEKADDSRLTMYVDKLLVKGGMSFAEIVSAVEARTKETGVEWRDFKNVSIIKKHIKYRATKGWIFTIFKNGKVKATDYAVDGNGLIEDKAAEAAAEEDKKAA
jgi:hypothetical protein